jgi:predicted ester cyclase
MDGNERIVRRYIDEVVNENRVSVIDEIFDVDYINHTPNGDLRGQDAMRGFIARVRVMLPDVRATVHDIFAAHDRVAVRLTLTGTYHGEILGVTCQGRPIALPEIQIYRLANAKIAERWFIADWRSVWQQLGAIR